MKKLLFLLLFISYPLYSQIAPISVNTENQLEFFKSNLKNLKDDKGNILTNSYDLDTLTLNSDSITESFGYSVSSAGDINGDGFGDIIIGFNTNNHPNIQWRALIYYGGILMDNFADVSLIGSYNSKRIISVSTAGDVNGDGFDDVIIVARSEDENTIGFVYIFKGGVNMDTLADFAFQSQEYGTGWSISSSTAGDVNNDGYSDWIIGVGGSGRFHAPYGKAYIYFGGIVLPKSANKILTSQISKTDVYFGRSVSTAGDVNGDGYSDVLVGSIGYNAFTGIVYIYYGGLNLSGSADITLTGEYSGNQFGKKIASAGDVNGDGYSDILVGALGFNTSSGRIYVFNGNVNMNNIPDVIITGESNYSNFGTSISSAGDVNGDGFSDIIIGSDSYNTNIGKINVYYGNSTMDSTSDIELIGEGNSSSFGYSVSSVLNFNGNNYPALIVGSPSIFNNFGRVNVYFPKPDIKISTKVLFEGLYSTVFNQLSRKDSVSVLLRNVNSPYDIMDSVKIEIDSNLFTGQCKFINAPTGDYYLVVGHFNSLETWSKVGGDYFSTIGLYSYDFTSSISQAYGNNLKIKGSKYCMFSGDVTQDGFINLSDLILINNDASNFTNGSYLVSDLTGDNIVDLNDVTLCSNNSVNFVSVIRP